MARIRTVKPQHWSDKELSKISLQAHLLWIGLWNFSDDEGVFENDAILIKSQVFPRRNDVRIEQVSQWLDQLAKARFVIPFTFNGTGYYIHRTFKTHQKIDKPQESKIPSDTIRRILDEHSDSDRPCIVEESKGKVEDGRGEESAHENFDQNNFSSPKNQKEKKYSSPGAEILYTIEHCLTVAMADDRWVRKNNASPELLTLFNSELESQAIYEKNPDDYKRHFFHWKQKQKNGTHQQSVKQPVNRKSAGAEQLLASLKADISSYSGSGQ